MRRTVNFLKNIIYSLSLKLDGKLQDERKRTASLHYLEISIEKPLKVSEYSENKILTHINDGNIRVHICTCSY